MPDGVWNSGQHNAPFTFMHTFSSPNPSGYNYYCSVHLAMMQGIVFVNSLPGSASRR
jgi:plastocyanin